MFQTIHWEQRNGIAWLTLNQPPSNNMNAAFFRELSRLVDDVLPHADFNALIIRGEGRHFSSGADLDDLLNRVNKASDEPDVPLFLKENNRTFLALNKLRVPVIAAIQGVCLGSALELALFCHFRICGETALLGLPEVSFNLMPGCGGTQLLPKLLTRASALSMMLGGANLNAREALQSGLVDRVVPNAELLTYCEQLAGRIGRNYDVDKKTYYCRHLLNAE